MEAHHLCEVEDVAGARDGARVRAHVLGSGANVERDAHHLGVMEGCGIGRSGAGLHVLGSGADMERDADHLNGGTSKWTARRRLLISIDQGDAMEIEEEEALVRYFFQPQRSSERASESIR